jgi:hypothetical protein
MKIYIMSILSEKNMQIFIFVDGKNGQQFAIQLSTEGGGVVHKLF